MGFVKQLIYSQTIAFSATNPAGAKTQRLRRLCLAPHPDEARRPRSGPQPSLHRSGAGRLDDTRSDGPRQSSGAVRRMDALGVNGYW